MVDFLMIRLGGLALLLLLVLTLSGCERRPEPGEPLPPGLAMPRFSLPLVSEEGTLDSEAYADKVLLVTFFATWCPGCIDEIPILIRLQQEFGDSDFSVLALSVDEEGPRVVARLVEQMGITYPVAMADRPTALGFGGLSYIPVSFLVDRKGALKFRYSGVADYEILAADIRAQLANGN